MVVCGGGFKGGSFKWCVDAGDRDVCVYTFRGRGRGTRPKLSEWERISMLADHYSAGFIETIVIELS